VTGEKKPVDEVIVTIAENANAPEDLCRSA
jgi:hypothetical protein